MEDKPKRGRPKVLTEEQRRSNKTQLMLNKEWYCKTCNNGVNYTLAGKFGHLKTKKHCKAISQFLEDLVNNIV